MSTNGVKAQLTAELAGLLKQLQAEFFAPLTAESQCWEPVNKFPIHTFSQIAGSVKLSDQAGDQNTLAAHQLFL